jgi:hypothetical protein
MDRGRGGRRACDRAERQSRADRQKRPAIRPSHHEILSLELAKP